MRDCGYSDIYLVSNSAKYKMSDKYLICVEVIFSFKRLWWKLKDLQPWTSQRLNVLKWWEL